MGGGCGFSLHLTTPLNPDGTTTAVSPDGTKTLHSQPPPVMAA